MASAAAANGAADARGAANEDDEDDEDEREECAMYDDERARVSCVVRLSMRGHEANAAGLTRAFHALRDAPFAPERDVRVREGRVFASDASEGAREGGMDVCLTWRARSCSSEERRLTRVVERAVRGEFGAGVFDVEVVLIAPGYVPLFSAREDASTLRLDGAERGVGFLDKGAATLTRTVDSQRLNAIRPRVHAFIAKIEDRMKVAHPNIAFGTDRFAFKEIGSRGGWRFDALVDLEDKDWEEVRLLASKDAPWVQFVDEMLPNGWNVAVSVVYSYPGAKNQEWHADGRHLDRECDFEGCGEAPPYGICVFMPLIDLNYEVGFTQFFLKSHKTSKLIGFGEASHILNASYDGILNAGQSVLYDYRLLHRGMANNSADVIRPVLQFLYTAPSYRETKNYGTESLWE